ncbi:MAG: ATP-binding cassette domain-containing protein [Phycisphaerae bacterium]|nr:ATP-binding cassette domain-containing protein [Phycisphaerae bacterium]
MTRASSHPLLEVENLHVRFASTDQHGRYATLHAVTGVSFRIAPGETLGIVGESGCGKSTLARAVLRLVPCTADRLHFAGQDLRSLRGRALRAVRREAQMVFQDPYGTLNPRMTVEQIVGEPLQVHRLVDDAGRRRRVIELLQRVGLSDDHLLRYPHEFSGGQRQRIGIARALATNPRLLVCDEPVSALDLSVQSQIINLIAGLRRDLGLACLFIAHNLAVVRHLCDRVAVLYLGRIVELGPTTAVFDDPRHPYTQSLLASVPRADPDEGRTLPTLTGEPPSPLNPPHGCTFHPRCPFVEPRCREIEPTLQAHAGLDHGHLAACHLAETLTPNATAHALSGLRA